MVALTFTGLPFGEDDLREKKRAVKIDLFDGAKTFEARRDALEGEARAAFEAVPAGLRPPISICKLQCGGMHTVALSPAGVPYSWGCNDEKALGREGPEEKALPVPLAIAVDAISVGGSHSIFYNTETGDVFMCGLYRVSKQ